MIKLEFEEELKEQFIYPKHPTLKRAYQGIIRMVFHEKRVVFQPTDLILGIIEYLGWEDDSNIDVPDKKAGPRYNKVKNILKSFEGSFTKFSGSGLEVFIFKMNNKRVSSFKELERLCALDTDMSELVATTEKLDLSQPWQDALVSNPTYPISSETSTIDYKNNEKKSTILEAKKRNMDKRHDGKVKGKALKIDPYNVPDSFSNEDIEGTESLQDEDFRNHPNSGHSVISDKAG